MRAFLQLFIGLLITLSALFIVAAIIYFRVEYDFTKSLRLGVLSGFFIAIIVSFFTALFLLIMRAGKKPQKSILRKNKKSKQTAKISESQNGKNIEQKIILLMDKELTIEVLLHAISHQHIGILTQSHDKEKIMSLKTADEIIELSINKLTRHTSQLIITSNKDSEDVKKIVTYMKMKELSFLQY
jgi:mannitol-specific phosphotransferase system IIBC component